MTGHRIPDPESIDDSMPAWRQERYGGADAVVRTTGRVPRPAPGEVLVRIRSCALNAGDARLMMGDPLLIRAAFGLRRPRHAIRGMDVAGTVVAVGDDGHGEWLDEEVVVELKGGGGLAEYAVAPVARLARRPAAVPPAVASCLPIAGGTAQQALDLAGVAAGRRVLVLGASGGVGTFAVQLAVRRGAEVWATCGARNRSRVEGLGATRTVDYRETPAGELPAGAFDAIVDIAGDAPLRTLRRLLTPAGVVVLVAGEGGRVLGPLPRMLRAAILSLGSRRRIRPLAATASSDGLHRLLALVEDGSIAPVIEREYGFEEAGDALSHLASGHVCGKLVVGAPAP